MYSKFVSLVLVLVVVLDAAQCLDKRSRRKDSRKREDKKGTFLTSNMIISCGLMCLISFI